MSHSMRKPSMSKLYAGRKQITGSNLCMLAGQFAVPYINWVLSSKKMFTGNVKTVNRSSSKLDQDLHHSYR